jgi:diketogulonate reductase-like aldo/keto reductase
LRINDAILSGVLPKSANPQHIEENAKLYDWTIGEEDMGFMNGLDQGLHCAWNPSNVV